MVLVWCLCFNLGCDIFIYTILLCLGGCSSSFIFIFHLPLLLFHKYILLVLLEICNLLYIYIYGAIILPLLNFFTFHKYPFNFFLCRIPPKVDLCTSILSCYNLLASKEVKLLLDLNRQNLQNHDVFPAMGLSSLLSPRDLTLLPPSIALISHAQPRLPFLVIEIGSLTSSPV